MPTILFVCQHGAAKSVVAAELCQRLADEAGLRVRAVARGTEPEPDVSPVAAAGLRAEGIRVRDPRPRAVTPEEVASAWRVVSFGPDVPGTRRPRARVERWEDVPAVSDGYEAARDAIMVHLRDLLMEAAGDRAVRQG